MGVPHELRRLQLQLQRAAVHLVLHARRLDVGRASRPLGGYQWGGGCWNDDNVDNSPGDPTQDPNTRGEGGDCSGFTFKVWRESTNVYDKGGYQWNMLRFVHGPYASGDFQAGAGEPNVTYYKNGLIMMDALASPYHIGMIYSRNSDGSDQIIEAKGEAYGTNIWTRTYRGNSDYGGVRRLGWAY